MFIYVCNFIAILFFKKLETPGNVYLEMRIAVTSPESTFKLQKLIEVREKLYFTHFPLNYMDTSPLTLCVQFS